MTCYTFYFSTTWIDTFPSKLGMLFTSYCTFHNLLKNSFQESPIGNPFKNLYRNPFGIWNFISISIQKIDIANTKCKMPEKIWLNTKERKDHVWIIDYGTLKHFHNRVKYGVCVYPLHPTHWQYSFSGL